MKRLRAVTRRLQVERQAVAIRRRFLPAHVRADIRDYELMISLFEQVLERNSDCLDVGANEGQLRREMVRVAPIGRHVAWEPLPSLAARLREEFPNVEVREAALGATSGEVDFQHAVDEPGWSGLRERRTPRGSRFQRIRVRSEMLDDALPPAVAPRLIKIDVEGAELDVLLGGRRTITTHRPIIVFEHGADAAALYGASAERIFQLLTVDLACVVHGLDWDGPYDADEFGRIVRNGERHNFMAVAVSDPRLARSRQSSSGGGK